MADSSRDHALPSLAPVSAVNPLSPPPAPPLPPQRYANRATNALARLAHPFMYISRPPSPQPGPTQHAQPSVRPRTSISLTESAPIITHKTGIPISAVDISPHRTHAVVAGREIFKTIRVTPGHCVEETNIRAAIVGYDSHNPSKALSSKSRDHLAAKDVKWSHSEYGRIIATAVANGRINIYDISRPNVEIGQFLEHNRQVHRLAFNPYKGAYLLSGSQDATVRLWDLRSLSRDKAAMRVGSIGRFKGNSEAVRDLRWSPTDPVAFATATDSGTIQRWDIRKENVPVIKINAHERACSSVDWHPNGKHLLSAGADRVAKVWEFSSNDRRRKPVFHLRAPQALLNARWRPPSNASETMSWESTHIATTYDAEDPRIHIWDLNRPYMPLKEVDRYSRSATDVLWHSSDYLWAVNGDGIFMQTDFKFFSPVIERRPPCSIAWSPDGRIVAFTESRPKMNLQRTDSNDDELFINSAIPIPLKNRKTEDRISTSNHSLAVDGSFDESLHISSSNKLTKRFHRRASKSANGSPPSRDEELAEDQLKSVLGNDYIETPKHGNTPSVHTQLGIVGHVGSTTLGRGLFQYFTHHYAPLVIPDPLSIGSQMDSESYLLSRLDKNTAVAEAANFTQHAQTWRMLRYAISEELNTKSKRRRNLINSGVVKPLLRTTAAASMIPAAPTDGNLAYSRFYTEKAKNQLLKGGIGAESQVPLPPPSEVEPRSGISTPLARPVPDSLLSGRVEAGKPEISNTTGIQPGRLKPVPLLSLTTKNLGNGEEYTKPLTPGGGRCHISTAELVNDSTGSGIQTPTNNKNTAENPDEIDAIMHHLKSAPRAIAGRAEWRNDDEDLDQRFRQDRNGGGPADERGFNNDPAKVPLKVPNSVRKSTSCGNQNGTVTYARQQSSSDSFTMFSSSTNSSQRSKSFGGESLSSLSNAAEMSRSDSYGGEWSSAGAETPLEGIPELEGSSPPQNQNARWESRNDSISEVSMDDLQNDSTSYKVNLERPTVDLPFLAESKPIKSIQWPMNTHGRFVHPSSRDQRKSPSEDRDHSLDSEQSGCILPLDAESVLDTPWGVQEVAREVIRYYWRSITVDIVTATHVLYQMHILFDSCKNLLPYQERELICSTYNEQLLRQNMIIEAAEFRISCVPAYPKIYEYAQQDTFINVFCYECNRPYENPKRDNKLCHRCNIAQPPCSICMSREPPAEWVTGSAPRNLYANSPPSPKPASTAEYTSPPDIYRQNGATTSDTDSLPRPHGSALWSWCQSCGHGAHTACLTAWLADILLSEGGCPTPGCLHDCGPGPRREQNRIAQQELSRKAKDMYYGRKTGVSGLVRKDSWVAGESRAAERVRGLLGGGTLTTTTSGLPSGTVDDTGVRVGGDGSHTLTSPRKVRLVTPYEERLEDK